MRALLRSVVRLQDTTLLLRTLRGLRPRTPVATMGPGPAKLPCGAPDRGVGSGRPALRYANGGSGAAAVPAQPAQQQQPRASKANIFEDIMAYIPDVKSDRDHDSDEVSADDGGEHGVAAEPCTDCNSFTAARARQL